MALRDRLFCDAGHAVAVVGIAANGLCRECDRARYRRIWAESPRRQYAQRKAYRARADERDALEVARLTERLRNG